MYLTQYQYDGLGNLLCVEQHGNVAPGTLGATGCSAAPSSDAGSPWRVRRFSYDSLSRLLTAKNPESGTITYAYDTDGELLQKTSPAPNQTGAATQSVSYCYDELHRVTGKAYGALSCPLAAPVVSYVYDSGANAKGKLTSLADQAGTASYGYDILGRMTGETRVIAGISKSLSYAYNLDGSMKSLTYPSGRVVTYTPDAAGRLVSAVDSNGTNYVTSAAYNAASSLTSLVNGGTITNSFLYNTRMQLCRITAYSSGSVPNSCIDSANHGNLMDRGYNYNLNAGDNGNVMGITNYRDATRSQSFTYDALNRLTSGWSAANTGAMSWGETYSIDAWGNLMIAPMANKAHGGTFQLAGDVNNRAAGLGYDAAGNLTNYTAPGQGVYDQENRLQSTAGMTYTYDANGRRVLKSNTSNGAAVKRYWSAGGNVVAEGDGTGNITSEYVYFGGKRVARIDLAAGSVHYYLSDHLNTTSVVATASGAIEEESDYSAFGAEYALTAGSNKYKFTGKERDGETNLDYFGARYYSNALGRWTSPDRPFADQHRGDPQSWNIYAYARNNPLRFIDENGLAVIETRKTEHYTVTGKTASQALNNANRHLGKNEAGATSSKMQIVNAEQKVTGVTPKDGGGFTGTVTLTKADVKLEQTVELPQWKSDNPAEQSKFDAAVDKLEKHEIEHEQINREEADKLDSSLPGTTGTGEGKTGQEAAQGAYNDMHTNAQKKADDAQNSADQRNQNLDKKTNHGTKDPD